MGNLPNDTIKLAASDDLFQTKYSLPMTEDDWQFLGRFIMITVNHWAEPADLIEVATVANYARANMTKFAFPEPRKLKLKLHEILALKKLLLLVRLPAEMNMDRNRLLAEIDQRTPGVYTNQNTPTVQAR